jgi:hypothetical protein
MKTCIQCGVEKEDDLFAKDRNTCKECRKEYKKKRCEKDKKEIVKRHEEHEEHMLKLSYYFS